VSDGAGNDDNIPGGVVAVRRAGEVSDAGGGVLQEFSNVPDEKLVVPLTTVLFMLLTGL